MKKILTTLFLLLFFSNIFAEISVVSFIKVENDLDARVYNSKKDQNGDVCAIIKVETTQTNFSWDSDGMGIVAVVPKVAEYWIYIPHGAKRLIIKHPQLGISPDYSYPIAIEKATVYKMKITTDKVVTTVVKEQIITEFVAINSNPTGADVYIDDKATGKQTPFSGQYPIGLHTYRLSMDLYHPDAGKFELKPEAGTYKIDSKLKPAFGQLQLSTLPETGASIKLDGKSLSQVTPCIIEKIKSGIHTVTVTKHLFHDLSETISITDEQTTTAKLELKPAYGSISLTSSPETGATVILDDEATGKTTPCIIDKVPSGTHTVSLRREWYEPIKKQITITDDEKAALDIPMNALFGTIEIVTNPEAEIFINNAKTSTGTYRGRLNEGIYTIEARKAKHTSDFQKVQITTGETKTVNLAPFPQKGMLEIQSTPMNATILIDGENKGTTPAIIRNLLEGDYKVTLSLANYNSVSENIAVTEGDTTRVNEILLSGRSDTISCTSGLSNLTIDGNSVGKTPYSGVLTNGNHILVFEKNGQKFQKSIYVSELSTDYFYINLTELTEMKAKGATEVIYQGDNSANFYLSAGILMPLVIKADGKTLANSGLGYNFRIGYVKTVGAYFKLSTNFSFANSYYMYANLPNTYYINSVPKSAFSRLGAVGGLMLRMKPVVMYAGAGWGYFKHFYKANLYNYSDDSFAKSTNLMTISQTGIETDAGIMININKVGFSAGVSSIDFKYMELNLGLALRF